MPSLDTTNNNYPLAADFSMYYRGTYVSRLDSKGQLQVMFVRAIHSSGDGICLDELQFEGDAFTKSGRYISDGEQVIWPAEEVIYRVPRFGYRLIGQTPVYFNMAVNNRSQKKGLHMDNVSSTPVVHYDRKTIFALLADEAFEGRITRDLVLVKDGDLLWRGEKVGTHIESVLTLSKQTEYLKEFLCKLLERSLEVKSVEITE